MFSLIGKLANQTDGEILCNFLYVFNTELVDLKNTFIIDWLKTLLLYKAWYGVLWSDIVKWSDGETNSVQLRELFKQLLCIHNFLNPPQHFSPAWPAAIEIQHFICRYANCI